MAEDILLNVVKTNDGSLFHRTITKADGTIRTIPPEAHSHYEIFYLLEGKVKYVIEGKKYELTPGDMIFVNIGEIHYVEADLKTNYDRVVFRFNKTILPSYFSSSQNLFLPLDETFSKKRHIKKKDIENTAIPSIIKEIIDVFAMDKYKHPLLISESIRLLVEINKIFEKQDLSLNENSINKPIQLALNYINENIDNRITLDDISNNVFLNKFYLSKLFKKETGMTINDYVTLKKIFKANELIESGMDAGVAATNVGYSNYSSFFYNYKKIFGKSPRTNHI